ncbi:MAG: restriction endonuclease [Dehalococcoidia bacterium]|jgi:hypothetical protein
MQTNWKSYEEVAVYLLSQCGNQLGLEKIEGKQKIQGHGSGNLWEIDAKGIKERNEGFIIIECRRYTKSKQSQEQMGGLAYRIMDTGADGGIIVSPLGLQEGARKIAASKNIVSVQLTPDSTATNYFMKFLNKIMIGTSDKIGIKETCSHVLLRTCQNCGERFTVLEDEKVCPSCSVKSL